MTSHSLSVSNESDKVGGGEESERGNYTVKGKRKQNGKANVMLGEGHWCSK